jgi:hypothetical protein
MQIFRIICKGLYLEIFLVQAGYGSKDRSLVSLDSSYRVKRGCDLLIFYKIAALLRWACFRYALNSRAGSGLL